MKKIVLKEIKEEQRNFLGGLLVSTPAEEEDPGIPVYSRAGKEIGFISDFTLPTKANKKFEKEAPAGLYRGGAVIMVMSRHGTLVVPDDRYGWWKPFAGIARFAEGHDLRLAGARELMEEAFVYDLKKTTRFVPAGKVAETEKNCSLGFTVEAVKEVDKLTVLGYEVNETNRAFEMVLSWDISCITEPFSVNLEEEWWSKGRSGVSVYAIDANGKITGVFSGQQGFVEILKLGIHETLKKYI